MEREPHREADGLDEAVRAFDRWNAADAAAAPDPPPASEDAAVRALRRGRAGSATARAWLRAVAALLLFGLGVLVGAGWRGPRPEREPPVPAAWAEHERRVLAEIRAGLGQDVAWFASAGGEVLLGFDDADAALERRVVFLELRDATGRVVHAPRLVLPDGREVHVRLPDLPRLSVRARESRPGRVTISCAAVFGDGATVAATTPTVASGERVLVGQVQTDGRPLALYAAAR